MTEPASETPTTATTSTTTAHSYRASFFSSLLSPALFWLSPLQSTLTFLKDIEILRFCRVNKEHHAILPKMRLNEYHTLTSENWTLIQQRQGPIIHSINLVDLSELKSIPQSQRDSITRITFEKLTSTVSCDLLPPRLEGLYTKTFTGHELPILPTTLKTLILGLKLTPTTLKRILSQVTNLTHLGICVYDASIDGSVFLILPRTIETLELQLFTCDLPESENGWPTGLKHLTIVRRNWNFNLPPLILPQSLVSLTLPYLDALVYEATLKTISTGMSSLRTINFDTGIGQVKCDFFSLLPRGCTELTLAGTYLPAYGQTIRDQCDSVKIESLPDTIEIIKWEFNDLPVNRWPNSLRVLHIYGDKFTQDLSNLPDSVEELFLPQNYTRTVGKWPKNLKKLNVGMAFACIASVERLPPSVIDISLSFSIVRKMLSSDTFMKTLPRLLRLSLFNDPGWSYPIDLRLLPSSVVDLRFSNAAALWIGKD